MADIEPLDLEMPEYLANFPISPSSEVKKDYAEFQEIHNALHTLAYYLKYIRTGMVSSDSKKPDASVPFTRFLQATAAEKIEEGSVCSPMEDGWRNGFAASDLAIIGQGRLSYNAGRTLRFAGLALESAEIGETFTVGVGPAIINVTGVKCGNPVYAQSAKTVTFYIDRDDNTIVTGHGWSGDGKLYLDAGHTTSAPGYPGLRPDGRYYFSPASVKIIGMGIADDYMLLGQEMIYLSSYVG